MNAFIHSMARRLVLMNKEADRFLKHTKKKYLIKMHVMRVTLFAFIIGGLVTNTNQYGSIDLWKAMDY